MLKKLLFISKELSLLGLKSESKLISSLMKAASSDGSGDIEGYGKEPDTEIINIDELIARPYKSGLKYIFNSLKNKWGFPRKEIYKSELMNALKDSIYRSVERLVNSEGYIKKYEKEILRLKQQSWPEESKQEAIEENKSQIKKSQDSMAESLSHCKEAISLYSELGGNLGKNIEQLISEEKEYKKLLDEIDRSSIPRYFDL